MPISRSVLERQLKLAQSERDAAAANVGPGILKRDPVWRSADAQCRQLSRRLRRVSEVEQLDADLKQRRASSDVGDE